MISINFLEGCQILIQVVFAQDLFHKHQKDLILQLCCTKVGESQKDHIRQALLQILLQNWTLIFFSDPRMFKCLFNCHAQLQIRFNESFDKLFGLLGHLSIPDFAIEVIVCGIYLLEDCCGIFTIERRFTSKENKCDYSNRPQITSLIVLPVEHLW